MKSGIVADIHKNYVIVLSNSGKFLKLKKTGKVNIGDIYCGKTYIRNKGLSAAAAVIIAAVMSFSGLNAYAHQIAGYVDLKENSKTIRLYYNRMGHIEKADGFDVSKIKNKTVKDAVKSINSEIKKENPVVNEKPDIKNTPFKKNGNNNENKNTSSSVNNKNKNNKSNVNSGNTKSQSSKDNAGSNAANSNNGSKSNGSTKSNAKSSKDNSSQNTHDNKVKAKK